MIDIDELKRLAMAATQDRFRGALMTRADRDFIKVCTPAVILELIEMAERAEKTPLQAAIDAGEDTTGLCTLRDAVSMMLESPHHYAKREMEMCFPIGGKWVNVELKITRAEDTHPSAEYATDEEVVAGVK